MDRFRTNSEWLEVVEELEEDEKDSRLPETTTGSKTGTSRETDHEAPQGYLRGAVESEAAKNLLAERCGRLCIAWRSASGAR